MSSNQIVYHNRYNMDKMYNAYDNKIGVAQLNAFSLLKPRPDQPQSENYQSHQNPQNLQFCQGHVWQGLISLTFHQVLMYHICLSHPKCLLSPSKHQIQHHWNLARHLCCASVLECSFWWQSKQLWEQPIYLSSLIENGECHHFCL